MYLRWILLIKVLAIWIPFGMFPINYFSRGAVLFLAMAVFTGCERCSEASVTQISGEPKQFDLYY